MAANLNLNLNLSLPLTQTAPPPLIWQSLAGDPVDIPPLFSYCFYSGEGHLEQEGIRWRHLELNPHSDRTVPPIYVCRVISRDFSFQPVTEEPVVRFRLQPTTEWYIYPPVHELNVNRIRSHSKVLAGTDLEELTLPDALDEAIFPMTAGDIRESVKANDVFGKEWKFRRVFRGNHHLLTVGWKDFVLAKGLQAGDSVVSLKKAVDSIFVSVIKPGAIGFGGAQEAITAMEAADEGSGFDVTYYPRRSTPFIVGAEQVVESSKKHWASGQRVRMEVGPQPWRAAFYGEVTSVAARKPEKGAGRLSGWNMLKVTWEQGNVCRHWVNAWDVTGYGTQFGPLPLQQETPGPAGNKKRIRSGQETRDPWLRL